MHTIRAFEPDTAELGTLTVQSTWCVVIHNLKLRREILRLRKSKRLRGSTEQSVIEDFVQTKLAEAKKSRKAATDLARAVRLLASAPTVRTPPGPPKELSASPGPSPAEIGNPADAPPSSQPVRPDKLRIGTGHAF
jgi:hypothetical protein